MVYLFNYFFVCERERKRQRDRDRDRDRQTDRLTDRPTDRSTDRQTGRSRDYLCQAALELSSCLNFPSLGIACVYHHILFYQMFLGGIFFFIFIRQGLMSPRLTSKSLFSKASLKLLIFLPQPPKYWYGMHVQPCLAFTELYKKKL